MIRTRSGTDFMPARVLWSLALTGALAAGFVAGQLAPDIAATFTAPRVVQHASAIPSLSGQDDYGTRHSVVPPLTSQDDYANRH